MHHTDRAGPDESLDELLKRVAKTTVQDDVPDLPADLAFLEVESLLPKLSPLALGGAEYVARLNFPHIKLIHISEMMHSILEAL